MTLACPRELAAVEKAYVEHGARLYQAFSPTPVTSTSPRMLWPRRSPRRCDADRRRGPDPIEEGTYELPDAPVWLAEALGELPE